MPIRHLQWDCLRDQGVTSVQARDSGLPDTCRNSTHPTGGCLHRVRLGPTFHPRCTRRWRGHTGTTCARDVSIGETHIKAAELPCRAIEHLDQVIHVYVSPNRDTEATTVFLVRAVRSTGVRPDIVTKGRAAIYPPALRCADGLCQARAPAEPV